MLPAPDQRLTSAENARHAVELFGRDVVVDWCEELVGGVATDDDPRYPDIARHELDDPRGRVAERLEDPVERVRQQAMRALGISTSAR